MLRVFGVSSTERSKLCSLPSVTRPVLPAFSRTASKGAVVLAVGILSIIGCNSEKSSAPSAKLPQKESLINRIPLSSYGVLVSKSGSDMMQQFQKTAWGKPSSYSIDQLKAVQSEEAEKAAAILDVLARSEFASAFGLAEGAISVEEVVAFIASVPQALAVGGVATAKEGGDFTALLEKVVAEMKGKSIAVEEVSPTNPRIVALPLELEDKELKIEKLFVAATQNKLAFSTEQSVFDRIFSSSAPSDLPPLLQKESFKGVFAKGNQDSVLSFGYLDLRDLLTHTATFESSDAENAGMTPAKLKETLETLPVEYLSYFRSMDKALVDEVTLKLDPQTEKQKEFVASLSSLQPQDLLKSAPSSFVLLVGADVDYFVKLAKKMAPEPDTNDPEAVAKAAQLAGVLEYLKTVESLNIGLRQSKGGSPFPDVTMFVASPEPDALYMQLKSLVMMGIKASPFKNLQWLKKQVEGLDVDYTLSPFGIGLFLAKTSNHIVFSSSEAGLVSVARSFKDGGDNLWDQLPSTVKSSLDSGAGFLSYSANLSEFGELLRSLQSSLSMFTGGQSPLKEDDIVRLKSLGTVIGTTRFDDNAFKFKAVYELGKS